MIFSYSMLNFASFLIFDFTKQKKQSKQQLGTLYPEVAISLHS